MDLSQQIILSYQNGAYFMRGETEQIEVPHTLDSIFFCNIIYKLVLKTHETNTLKNSLDRLYTVKNSIDRLYTVKNSMIRVL